MRELQIVFFRNGPDRWEINRAKKDRTITNSESSQTVDKKDLVVATSDKNIKAPMFEGRFGVGQNGSKKTGGSVKSVFLCCLKSDISTTSLN